MIVILGILVAVAIPKYVSLSKDARVVALTQIQVSVEAANDFMFIKSKLPSYAAKDVPNRDDLIDVDTNGDGVYDTRLKWSYLDNTDIETRIELSGDFNIEYQGIAFTYIGYNFTENLLVRDENCYFKYTQASSANVPPVYELITDGC